MKTIKLLLFFAAFSAVTFYSCSDSNPIDNQNNAQKSIALRTVLNKLKTENNLSGKSTMDTICFQFVYPVAFSYNNGTAVTASSFAGLLEILANESPNFFLDGITFPFQVMQSGAVSTINSETEFTTLIEDCGFATYNNSLQTTFCFDIVFPIDVIAPNGDTITLNTMEQFTSYLNSPANGNEIQIVFPISVLYSGQVVVVNNVYDFYEIINNCTSCNCSQVYAPVCVQNAAGDVMEFGNVCYALCAGYSQNDIVSCNPMNECNITNVTISTGSCNADGTFPLSIDFDYINPGSTQFEVISSTNDSIGTYNVADLPITISSYPHANTSSDYLNVSIIGSTCAVNHEFAAPVCGCNCSGTVNPVCVQTANGTIQFDNQCLATCAGYTPNDFVTCAPSYNFGSLLGTCFTIVYPITIQYQGALVFVNNNGQLLQYWFPASSPMPAFSYPITVTFANVPLPITIGSQAQFESQISQSCL